MCIYSSETFFFFLEKKYYYYYFVFSSGSLHPEIIEPKGGPGNPTDQSLLEVIKHGFQKSLLKPGDLCVCVYNPGTSTVVTVKTCQDI